jgi:hypothetical protein
VNNNPSFTSYNSYLDTNSLATKRNSISVQSDLKQFMNLKLKNYSSSQTNLLALNKKSYMNINNSSSNLLSGSSIHKNNFLSTSFERPSLMNNWNMNDAKRKSQSDVFNLRDIGAFNKARSSSLYCSEFDLFDFKEARYYNKSELTSKIFYLIIC